MLRTDDGDLYPGDEAYVDGYALEERLLEGVRFKIEVKALGLGYQLVCNGVHPEDKDYMLKFSKKQLAEWYLEAVRYMTDGGGDATTEDGTNVHWGDA